MGRDAAVVKKKDEIRRRVWDILERTNAAAFPRPVVGRIPNFKGAEEACARLRSTRIWASARVVKINPDAPQRPCREAALAEGKILIMPTPRIRNGFLLLDPRRIPPSAFRRASTISGAFEHGADVRPWDLPPVDLAVIGSVAVNPRTGARLGKSHGYAELEWGILTALGKATASTPVATTVHELQLVDDDIPREPFDLPIDVVATPARVIEVGAADKPLGVLWDYVDEALLRDVPLLAELRARMGGRGRL